MLCSCTWTLRRLQLFKILNEELVHQLGASADLSLLPCRGSFFPPELNQRLSCSLSGSHLLAMLPSGLAIIDTGTGKCIVWPLAMHHDF